MATETIVLDNSVNSRLLWPDVESPANNRYARRVIQRATRGSELRVPTIWHYEAANVAATLVRKGHVSRGRVAFPCNASRRPGVITPPASYRVSARTGSATAGRVCNDDARTPKGPSDPHHPPTSRP